MILFEPGMGPIRLTTPDPHESLLFWTVSDSLDRPNEGVQVRYQITDSDLDIINKHLAIWRKETYDELPSPP